MTMQDSSGLHSLAALREYERRQAERQASAARHRAEAEQRARLEVEREAARAEHERQLSERRAENAAELARREEVVRLEAACLAERARAERAERERESLQSELATERGARRSAELAAATRLFRQRLLALSGAALCLASLLGTAALYFGSLRPAAERVQVAERSLSDERRARKEAEASEARLLRRNELLAERVSSLESLSKSVPEPPPAGVGARDHGAPTLKPGIRRPPATKPPPSPCRDDGDPLNPCLKTH